MARDKQTADEVVWSSVQELFDQGDPAFVDQLRRVTDAEKLGKFGGAWLKDRRPASRRLMLEYLGRPLNAFRHEALVKRLFKKAEQAGDDEVMAHFLVLFDRSVRRVRKNRRFTEYRTVKTEAEAKALLKQWTAQGYEGVNYYRSGRQWYVYGYHTEEVFGLPSHSTMWRPPQKQQKKPHPIDDKQREKWEEQCRLFTPQTRKYLRRRAWRYFRRLGKEHPERYLPAVARALKLYRDADVPSVVSLLDNWGLIHILFHHCPALDASPGGWRLAEKHTLAELEPAPYLEPLWKESPRALLDLLKGARCRPVRQWAIFLLRRDQGETLKTLPLEELFALLAHEGAEVVELAADLLRHRPGLAELSVERWLELLETANPQALDILCELVAEKLHPERATLEQAVQLARSRPLPVARLGFSWLRSRRPETEADCRALLGLVDAEAEPMRAELVRWARGVLSPSPHFQAEWVLEYLDSRHADVRGEGLRWLLNEPRAKDNVDVWQRLMESPYDDVRLLLVADLEDRVSHGDATLTDTQPLNSELLRLLWATVLLNVHRGGRIKPLAVRQLVRRIERRHEEAPLLLPVLAAALRSVRGPEWRAGLAGVVQLVERAPSLAPLVRKTFPELAWAEEEAAST